MNSAQRCRELNELAMMLCEEHGFVAVAVAAKKCPELASAHLEPPLTRPTPDLIVDSSHPFVAGVKV
jgi:hypothetical protein